MMTRIRFPTRMAHATDDDAPTRYALQGTLVTPNGYAVATDGRIAACTKVDIDELKVATMIPKELGPKSKADLAAQYHANGRSRCEKHSTAKGQQRVEQAEVREGRFPKVGDIFQAVDAAASCILALNAEYLWRLAQAINLPDSSDVVVLLIPPPDQEGLVTNVVGVLANQESLAEAHGFGVLMPCDAEAKQVRKDFDKLRKAAVDSLDRAATAWSEQRLGKNATNSADQQPAKASPVQPGTPPQPVRKRKVTKPRKADCPQPLSA